MGQNTQDVKNQKLGVLDYCNAQSLNPIKFIEDTMSGKAPWKERSIGKLLTDGKSGDVIIVAKVSRLGRSILQVLEILEVAAQKGISVHIAKNRMVMDGSMQSTITATILGLVAQIEREFIVITHQRSITKKKNGRHDAWSSKR